MKRLLAALVLATPLPAAAGEVVVTIDNPVRYALPDGVESVFVANPVVADVQVVSADQMMVLGRAPGRAEVVLYGANGTRLETVRVQVGNARTGVVTLYNGSQRYSFHCIDRCEQAPMIGDGGLVDLNGFARTLQQRATMSAMQGRVTAQPVEVQSSAPQASGLQGGPGGGTTLSDPAS